jgi:hypothetical protein
MSESVIKLKKFIRDKLRRLERPEPPPQRDGGFGRDSRAREIAQASPERAGELAGHPVEHVDT